ncbi:Serine/threonine-protein kinase PknB [bacterium HR11]|nr:Serine/threonine-protein kinase PknB [bacterium HR11]
MGKVYHAWDPLMDRDVALKVLHPRLAARPAFRDRFVREAQSAGRLRHPNIVTIYELGEAGGVPYIVMEYLEGRDLHRIIRERVPLSLRERLDIIVQACEGLGYAHAQGVVHRDIKPSNIRVLDDGRVKIMDFGIAKIESKHLYTKTGFLIGTPRYMAPERIRGPREKVDGRADIFSLGVVMYELLFYRHPFEAEDLSTLLYKILHEPPDPLDVAGPAPGLEDLRRVLQKAMAKDPADRYPSAYDMARDVRALMERLSDTGVAVRTAVPIWDEPTLGLYGVTPPPVSAEASVVPTPPAVSAPSLEAETVREARPVRPRVRPGPWIVRSGLLLTLLLLLLIPAYRRWASDRPTAGPTTPAVEPDRGVSTGSSPSVQAGRPVKPSPDSETPPAVPAVGADRPGTLVLDLLPWAEIRDIRRVPDGTPVELTRPAYTPLRVPDLPPGRYEVRYRHPRMSADDVLVVDVGPGEVREVIQPIRKLDLPPVLGEPP